MTNLPQIIDLRVVTNKPQITDPRVVTNKPQIIDLRVVVLKKYLHMCCMHTIWIPHVYYQSHTAQNFNYLEIVG